MESDRSAPTPQRLPIVALQTGIGISIAGSVMTLIAFPWFVLQTTGSAAKIGITLAVWILPVILSGALAGPIVDRVGHKHSAVLGDLGAGICVALVPTLYHSVGLIFPMLLVIVFVRGLFDFPARTGRASLMPRLADLAAWPLERANSLFATIQNLALLVGPAIAGLLIARFSASNVLWIDGATFGFSALMTALFVPADRSAESAREPYRERLLAGFRFVRRDEVLLTFLFFITINRFLTSPLFDVEMPVFSRRVFGSAVALGLMSAGYGAGSLASSFLFGIVGARLPRRSVLIGAVLATAVTIGLLSLEPALPIAVLLLAVTGFAAGPIGPLYQTVVQERVSSDMRGRVFGLGGVTMIAMPLGMLGSGFLLQGFGIRATLTLQASLILIAAVALALIPALRAVDTTRGKDEIDVTPTPAHQMAERTTASIQSDVSDDLRIDSGGELMSDQRNRNPSRGSSEEPPEHPMNRQTRQGWLDEIIQRAEADGQFRNLPGEGKPLPGSHPYESLDEWAMAHHILKQSGFLPPWLQLRKEVAAEKGAVVAALEDYRRQRVQRHAADPALERLAERYVTLAREINKKIDEHNVLRPSAMPELIRFQEDAVKR